MASACDFLDIARASDTISHHTLLWVARAAGLPPLHTNYLNHLYSNPVIQLESAIVKCGRGVQQGGPLSPLLLIIAMDYLLMDTIPEIGFQFGNSKIGADDLVLVAQSPSRLQEKSTALISSLRASGTSLNAEKSTALTILKDRKQESEFISHLILRG